MSQETLKRVMEALAGVAEAVGNLRALLPAGGDRLDELAQNVCEFGDEVLEAAMLGEVGSPERCGERVRPAAGDRKPEGGDRRPEAGKKAPAKAGKAAVSPPAGGAGAGDRPAPQCVDCGGPYTRTSGPQKRCPECAEARKKTYKAEWQARNREKNPAATPDRLARIKAVNEKLDRIPEPGS